MRNHENADVHNNDEHHAENMHCNVPLNPDDDTRSIMYPICGAMKLAEVALDDVMRSVFYFTLEGNARTWLFTLPQHYSTLTWEQLKKAFLAKVLSIF